MDRGQSRTRRCVVGSLNQGEDSAVDGSGGRGARGAIGPINIGSYRLSLALRRGYGAISCHE